MTTFDEHELQMIVLALRLWRAQRGSGAMRKSDPAIPPQTLEILLAKIEASRLSSRPPRASDDPTDPFQGLFGR